MPPVNRNKADRAERADRAGEARGVPPRRNQARARRLKTDSLAFAMLEAARAVHTVRAGRSLVEALAQAFARVDARGARGAIQDLAYRAMRQRGLADALVRRLTSDRVLEPPLVRELLVVALALLLAAPRARRGTETEIDTIPPYPAFTVVDQAVEAAKATPELARVAGLVNAVLRNYVRDPNVHRAFAADMDPEAAHNHPHWWIDRLRRAYPTAWEELLRIDDLRPPLTLRVNLAKTHPAQVLARFAEAGLAARRIGPCALRLDVPVPVERIPGFAEGLVSVQDEAAQRAAPLLDLDDGMRVLDACAAPGGKTGHILEIADVELLALDLDRGRLDMVGDNLRRLGFAEDLRVRFAVGDVLRPDDWWDGRPFDRILADVPCSASGIVRRHPDIRWLRRDSDIEALAEVQTRMFDTLWRLLAPGGKLLYVTCSIFPEESLRQAQAFAARHADARALPAPGQLLPVAEVERDHDGLFFALFEKLPQ